MGWQGTLKLWFMFLLPVTDPEIAPHVWKIGLCGER